MRFINFISDMIMPLVVAYIIFYGIGKRVKIYDSFITGAQKGFKTVLEIMPTLIGLMTAVGVMQHSGLLGIVTEWVRPFCDIVGFPAAAVPLTVMRLVSSSAATGLLLDIFKQYTPDSFTGRFVSVMMCCTETVFYTISVYFMSIKATKTRYTLAGALIANAAGTAASLVICKLLWG
ncbi:MAG: spore maturation protein [Firmicutes bacterium]|nr:spore maturation protein [Bacillota bacterium]